MKFRMKDGHPVNVKLQRIFDLMDELKISLDVLRPVSWLYRRGQERAV